jgi:hypothetical protein
LKKQEGLGQLITSIIPPESTIFFAMKNDRKMFESFPEFENSLSHYGTDVIRKE